MYFEQDFLKTKLYYITKLANDTHFHYVFPKSSIYIYIYIYIYTYMRGEARIQLSLHAYHAERRVNRQPGDRSGTRREEDAFRITVSLEKSSKLILFLKIETLIIIMAHFEPTGT